MGKDEQGGGGESTLTVVVALLANAGIAVAKGITALLSGSAAMAAETAHSVADTFNEVILLTALKRSERPADREHPLGYGKERYFWSFLAAISIFVSGAVFSFIEGFRALFAGEEQSGNPWPSFIVLGIAFVLEGISWLRAVKQVRKEAADESRSWHGYMRHTDDPTVKTVALEDSAALVGIVFAFAGVWLHHVTGSGVYDAIASFLIGLTLSYVAFALGRTNKNLLVGSTADPRLVAAIEQWVQDREEVKDVVELVTMRIGTDKALVCGHLDFHDDLDSQGLEQCCLAMDEELRRRFPDVEEVFLQPVPSGDHSIRRRAARRGLTGEPGAARGVRDRVRPTPETTG